MATGNFFVDKTRTVTLENVYQGLEKPNANQFRAGSLIWDRARKTWYMNVSGSWVIASFSGSTFALGDLTNVGTTGATDGQAIVFDAATSEWGPGTVAASSGSATALNDLSDVTIVSAVSNDILYYDGSTWRRQPFSTQEAYSSASDVLTDVRPYIDAVAGGGFSNVSGAVTLDLDSGRSFHHTMTGNITSLALSNIPAAADYATSWVWVLQIDATGGYTLSSTPTVTWLDGSTFSDLDLTANSVNIVQFIRIGAVTYATLLYNGSLKLDSYKFSFQTNETIKIVLDQSEQLDVSQSVTDGTGTITYAKNGSPITTLTTFASGDAFSVTVSGSSASVAVTVPRFLS